ncbi:MAG: RNA polymerase sigma factor [Solirubrobacterales bacterium]
MTSTSDRSSTCPDRAIEQIFRADWGRLLSLLVSRTRRLDLAEDALGEAFARASDRWPGDGVPANPAGWLYATAYRHVVGRLRAEAVAGRKAPLLAVRPGLVPPVETRDELADDRLQLILLCCHPALQRESRSALALRLVIGTPTEQIADLFLVPPATMAARLTRAKRKIVLAGIPLGAPLADELATRLDEVCRTIYLAFTAGYAPGAGPDLLRADLAGDAVRLAAVLHHLVPDGPQVRAMLALLVLQHSRRDARQRHGRLVTLADQDRSMWHDDEIRAGLGLAAGLQPVEGYAEDLRLQALIAAEHARAPTAAATDWTAIAGHYATLEARTGSAIVRLNRAVAIVEVQGPPAGLALLDGLDDVLRGNHRVAAVRAELAQRVGDVDLARASYRKAIDVCSNDVERAHLTARLEAIRTPDP